MRIRPTSKTHLTQGFAKAPWKGPAWLREGGLPTAAVQPSCQVKPTLEDVRSRSISVSHCTKGWSHCPEDKFTTSENNTSFPTAKLAKRIQEENPCLSNSLST